jgi:hypothetical protein
MGFDFIIMHLPGNAKALAFQGERTSNVHVGEDIIPPIRNMPNVLGARQTHAPLMLFVKEAKQ